MRSAQPSVLSNKSTKIDEPVFSHPEAVSLKTDDGTPSELKSTRYVSPSSSYTSERGIADDAYSTEVLDITQKNWPMLREGNSPTPDAADDPLKSPNALARNRSEPGRQPNRKSVSKSIPIDTANWSIFAVRSGRLSEGFR